MTDCIDPARRWTVLALLFSVRTAMAFQFQSVATLAPALQRDLGFDTADLGFLIGIYLAPGIVLAAPGGSLGRRLGDRTVVLTGLGLMVAGGLVMIVDHSWPLQLVGRIVSGVGGVLLNVSMSKMVTDWFAGREIATAMGIFLNSWPVGIALALVMLPLVSEHGSLSHSFVAAILPAMLSAAAFAWLYRTPNLPAAPSEAGSSPTGRALMAIVVAGAIWGLYNAAIAMIFSFGAMLLMEKGWSPAPASQATSIVLWLTAVSVPLGGFLADLTGRPRDVLVAGLLIFAGFMIATAQGHASLLGLVGIGLVCGIPAGPIMSLPARVLAPPIRSAGMGIFYTVFYTLIVLAPLIAGWIAAQAGGARETFHLGAFLLLLTIPCIVVFEGLAAGHEATA